MNCSDVLKLLPELALGDLDAEPAAGVAAHLRTCEACRAENDALGRTVNLMRVTQPVSPSTERRTVTVAAMARAHAAEAPRRSLSWAPWATAAAFLLAVVAALSSRTGGPAFSVAQVSGRALLLERRTGVWRPVSAGEMISVGDRLVTEPGGFVRLSADGAELSLDQDSSFDVVAPRRVTLDRGRVLAVVSGPSAEPLIVTDTANHSAVVKGRVELALREVTGLLAGSVESRNQPPILPPARKEVRRHLVARVAEGEVRLNGSEDQRLHAAAGQEGTFTFVGQPATAPLEDAEVGTWAESGSSERKK